MTSTIDLVLFDIGGVLGSNAWDHEQRAAAIERFNLDAEDFNYRHEELAGGVEVGQISLDEYLDVAVFSESRAFSREDFKEFMFAQSVPWPDSIAVAETIADSGVRIATLNNEGADLNNFRIQHFGLRGIFPTFFSSCWLGVRKPARKIYERALAMAQADPKRTLFIDDRLQNLAPAMSLGVRTIHFQSAAQLRKDVKVYGLL
ncbi:MAG: HAD family phosphatase [Gemmatimonadaceae bacterium]